MPHVSPAKTAALIQSRCDLRPVLGLVLGSCFGDVATSVRLSAQFAFDALPGFLCPSVRGHAGQLLLGHLGDTPVAVLAGRVHSYEVADRDAITFPTRVLATLGVRALVLTNAAGGIRPDLAPGDFVIMSDHINFMGFNPLQGEVGDERFVDMSEAYSSRLGAMLRRAMIGTGTPVKKGIYIAVTGPSFETPSEIRAFRAMGADLVGMSTVPEVIVARRCGLEVAALSCVTNRAAGLGGRISHQEVLTVGQQVAARAAQILISFARIYHQDAPVNQTTG